MTLQEAITNLECLAQSEEACLEDDEKDAITLGIEALKEIMRHRRPTNLAVIGQLPGETYAWKGDH